MDSVILHFLAGHWLDLILGILIFFVITTNFIPAKYAGLSETYTDNFGNERKQEKQSLTTALTTFLFYTLLKSFMVTLTLKGAVSLIMFLVVGVELISTHTISTNAVIISVVAIIALYAESLIEKAKKFSIFNLFTYESRN